MVTSKPGDSILSDMSLQGCTRNGASAHLPGLLGLATSSRRTEAYHSWPRENASLHTNLQQMQPTGWMPPIHHWRISAFSVNHCCTKPIEARYRSMILYSALFYWTAVLS